jgi:hypothetical protein
MNTARARISVINLTLSPLQSAFGEFQLHAEASARKAHTSHKEGMLLTFRRSPKTLTRNSNKAEHV